MTRTRMICTIIALSQLALGAIYLVAPGAFIAWQGLTPIAPDTGYPLAMLAGRFLVYGVGMLMIAREPVKYRLWLDGMIAIQLVDLLAGLAYVSAGIVPLGVAAFPMFDAALFIALLIWVRPAQGASVSPQS